MQINPISNSYYKQAFQGGMVVYDQKAQQMILKNISAKQLEARIMCTHFIRNFKEYYKQIPIFESKFGFIKRMSKRMDKYKTTLQQAEIKE